MNSPRKGLLLLVSLSLVLIFGLSACVPQASAIAPAGGSQPSVATTLQNLANGQVMGITVQGDGSVFASPDQAEVLLGVSANAPTVAEAQNDASTRMSQVMESLTGMGISEDQIKTVRFAIFPQYGQGERLTGYIVENIVSAKIMDTGRVGEVLDAAVTAGANRVERVSFMIADPKPLAARAREAAMADAKAKADQLATLAGVSLGMPVSIVESSTGGTPPVPFGLGGDARAAVAPPISPGETEVRVSILVTFALQ